MTAEARPASAPSAAAPCDHEQRIHLRPLLLFVESRRDYNVLKQWATLRCYACGTKWIEDSHVE
jgi:hypothetical protein